jgi:Ankyrin repeats (3 copies)
MYQTRFRWAVCQLDALGKCLNLLRLRKALEGLPDTLDSTYDRILCAIDKENSQDALKILQWLVYSARPLRIDEVVDVIAVFVDNDPRFDIENRLPDPQDILTICSSLVTIAGAEIRLAHFSVKEYLMSERIQNGPARQYSIQEIHANVSIAEVCLAYLLTCHTAEEFPLSRYAAKYWTQHAQVAREDAEVMHQLIMELFLSKRGAYVNWVRLFDPDKSWKKSGSKGVAPPLYYASLAGLIESVRRLLEKGADVNAQGGFYSSALQVALYKGHDQIVQQLLKKGSDINAQGGFYCNALQAASCEGHYQIVQQLLEKGADVNAQGGVYDNALQAASARGHHQIVQQLLEKGAHS